jgi:hypothetical protein
MQPGRNWVLPGSKRWNSLALRYAMGMFSELVNQSIMNYTRRSTPATVVTILDTWLTLLVQQMYSVKSCYLTTSLGASVLSNNLG